MPTISEQALTVAISALAARIRDLKLQLRANDNKSEDDLSEDEIDAHVELQDTVKQYGSILAQLRDEYEAVLAEGRVGGLPSYEELTKPFRLDPA
jgi:hypothetical protein